MEEVLELEMVEQMVLEDLAVEQLLEQIHLMLMQIKVAVELLELMEVATQQLV